ncbi:hypothetical protein [Inquilinus sp. CAU 1745]|uniref:hypothetical protein n=1 Tax=Inquilinus sp. CAU 1745 TaxID=3140369 RepID=UPI00325B5B9E
MPFDPFFHTCGLEQQNSLRRGIAERLIKSMQFGDEFNDRLFDNEHELYYGSINGNKGRVKYIDELSWKRSDTNGIDL